MSYPRRWRMDSAWSSATGDRSAWGAPTTRPGHDATSPTGSARAAPAPAAPSGDLPGVSEQSNPPPAPSIDPLRLVALGLTWDGAARRASGELVLATKDGRVITLDASLDGRVSGSACDGPREVAYGEWDMPDGLDLPSSITHLRKLADRIAWVGQEAA